MIFKRNFPIVILLAALFSLAGCGGGGSNGSNSSGAVVSSPALVGANVLPIIIDGAPGIVPGQIYANGPFVSVKVCVPGTSNCQTIDHVLLDSGSTGLRIFSTVLTNPVVANALVPVSVGGSQLAECAVFASGYTWGSVKLADVHLAGETASSVPIQIMADAAVPATPPSSCPGVSQNSVQAFGANGVLGVSTFQQDCGAACAQSAVTGATSYYTCPAAICSPVIVATASQVQNPVAMQTADNNGVAIVLPPLTTGSAVSVSGWLILGIGTQSNNTLGSATSYDLDAFGNLLTTYKNQLMSAFVDSGSNALFFPDTTIPVCSSPYQGFYCPVASLSLSAVIQGAFNSRTAPISFNVANTSTLFNNSQAYTAFNNLAGTSVLPGTFDWGLPFFFGRQVYFAIEQKATPLGTGPYVAF